MLVSHPRPYEAHIVGSNNGVPISQTLNSRSGLREHLHSNNPQSISLAVRRMATVYRAETNAQPLLALGNQQVRSCGRSQDRDQHRRSTGHPD